MKKKLKIIVMILIVFLICFISTEVFADSNGEMSSSGGSTSLGGGETMSSFTNKLKDYKPDPTLGRSLTSKINKVLGIIQVIGIIISIVLIGYIGLKSVFGSLAEKSEAKQSVGPFVLGAILLTSGCTIVKFIVSFVETK